MAPRRDVSALQLRYYHGRDPNDREALVERFLPLARHLARRYDAPGERDDVEQVACVGLLKAIERYDPTRGIAFTSFALPTILGEIKRYFRDCGWAVHVPRPLQELAGRIDGVVETLTGELGRSPTTEEIAIRTGESVERILEARATVTAHRPDSLDGARRDDEDDAPAGEIAWEDPGYAWVERGLDFDRLLERLPTPERAVLRLSFQEDLIQRDIAQRMGVSQMQVSRWFRGAIAELACG
jgi:RNA polymerase sigma-B factor